MPLATDPAMLLAVSATEDKTAEPQVIVAPSRLRHGAGPLFGREQQLAALDQAWNSPSTHVLTIVAWGGVGKTSLVIEWMARKAAANWPGFHSVFDWSFYSQGTREQGAASGDTFIAAALEFFGGEEGRQLAGTPASAWDKGAKLAQWVAQRRSLLVLDGIEPLQYPPGPLAGQLKDPALESLLKGLAQQSAGLCLVTTRERVTDLASYCGKTVQEWLLEHLSKEAGAALLHHAGAKLAGAGVIQPDDPELRAASAEVNGHALTLSLLGTYLAKAHGGDVRKRGQVKFDDADAKIQGGHAFKTMAAYETWLTGAGADGQRQLAVLRLLGLFDRPADAGCLAALRRAPAIPTLAEPLVDLGEADWNLAVSSLADCGLVTVHASQPSALDSQPSLDAHPLIREYFAKQLRERRAVAWREGHGRLYEHLKASVPYWPEGLEGLQPLYQAVAHGCHAGLHEEARAQVYRDRILRGTGDAGFYSTSKLGAFGADLGAVACFFEEPWTRLAPALSEAAQAWLLHQAAFSLRALGRLGEALEPMRAALDATLRQENWRQAAIGASNLSELELMLGEMAAGVGDAEQSVAFADRSGDALVRMVFRTTLADALHQAGREPEALALFREAEAMQAKRQPEYPLLYSLSGFHYCDLLLAEAERAAWQALLRRSRREEAQTETQPAGGAGLKEDQSLLTSAPTAIESCRESERAAGRCSAGVSPAGLPGVPPGGSGGETPPEPAAGTAALLQSCRAVERRAAQTLKWAQQHLGPLDIALDHLTLGRAALYAAILENSPLVTRHSSPATRHPPIATCHSSLAAAVDGLRAAGHQDDLPLGLLTRAWCSFAEAAEHRRRDEQTKAGDCESSARADLDEAWQIAERGSMRLFMADIHLHRARLFRDKHSLNQAEELIAQCGYDRRKDELADAKAAAESWPDTPASSPGQPTTQTQPVTTHTKRFSIAFSFPDGHRAFVEQVAAQLASSVGRDRVLYDRYFEAEFARPDLDVYLPNLYRAESELIVIFLCADYANKRWCKLEWRFIRQLICTSEADRIMFLSFDDIGAVPEIGILSGDGYISIASRTPLEIADLILQRRR